MEQSWKFGIVSGLALIGIFSTATHAVAQNITLDGTVGSAGTLTGPRYEIPQQAGRRVGNNLFHSLGQFNLNTNEVASFQGAGITNILTRVTGGRSNLDGRIEAPANFFLINPAGISFGRNARLDIRGSFIATSASAIGFPNGGAFSLTSPVDTTNSLLTVNPSALLFNQIAQPIVNRSIAVNPATRVATGLEVPKNQSLLLVGGEVRLEGGRMFAPGGRVELASIGGSGAVGLATDGSQMRLNLPSEVQRSDVHLTNGADVNVRSDNRGSVAIHARNLNMIGGSSLRAGIDSGLGSASSQANNVDINATETITLTDASFIANSIRPRAKGNGGNINITTGSLLATKGAELFTSTSERGQGNAGSVIIQARDRVSFDGYGFVNQQARSTGIFSEVEKGGIGQGGSIDITAHSLDVTNGAALSTNTWALGSAGSLNVKASDIRVSGASPISPSDGSRFSTLSAETIGIGNAGAITINTGKLLIEDGGQISTATSGTGQGGPLTVTATDSIVVRGSATRSASDQAADNLSRLTTRTEAGGNAGDLTLKTGRFEITGGAQVSAGTNTVFGSLNTGNGGVLTVNAEDSVVVSGESLRDNDVSRLTARTEGQGNAKALTINTRNLVIADGAQVSAGAFETGQGGTLRVNALDLVEVSGAAQTGILSRLATRTQGSGSASALAIATKNLIVRDGGQIDVRSSNAGEAGNLEIAARSIRLDDKGQLTAEATSVSGGNIVLRVQDVLQLRRNSKISATAQAGGDGGNITINANRGFLVAAPLENSDIVANAGNGKGGGVAITAQGIFGLVPRSRAELERLDSTLNPANLPTNDITAISQANPSLSGQVTINTPDVDPSRGLVALPSEPVNMTLAQGCQVRGNQASRFVITGRGGLPSDPREALSSDTVQVDLVTRNSETENQAIGRSKPSAGFSSQPIVEAQGWIVNQKGDVSLVAQAPTASPHSSWRTSPTCPKS